MTSGDSAFPWDVKFTVEATGTEYGFMLVSPKGQSKQISFDETANVSEYSADRMNTTDITQTRDNGVLSDTPFSMNDFTGGCGQLEYDFNDDTKYWWSNGVITHVSGRVYPAPPASTLALSGSSGPISGFTTYYKAATGVRYDFMWEGNNLWRRDASNNTNAWVKVWSTSVPITDFKMMNGIGLIAVPTHATTGIDFYSMADVTAAATWAPTSYDHTGFSNTLGKPKYFQVVRGTCYALVDKNRVFYTTDPTVDGWAGPIDVAIEGNIAGTPGDSTYPFVGVNSVGDFLFARKMDAILSVDSQQDVLQVIWQWKEKPSENNFTYACSGADQLLYSVGPDFYTYDPTTGVSFPSGLAKLAGFSTKKILGLDADNQYCYVLAQVRVPTIRSADSVALLRGIRGRGNSWVFEVLWEDTELTGKTYGVLRAMPNGVGTRLYWGQDNASNTVTYVMDIPAEWDESNSGSFATGTSLWTSTSRSGYPGFTKHHLYFNINDVNLDGSNTIGVSYSTDLGVSFTSLITSSANRTEASFDDVNGYSINFRFDFTSNGTICPIMFNFDHHQRIRFKYLPQVQLAVRIADGIETRNEGKSNKTIWQLWDDLTYLRTLDTKINYTDFLGNSYPVTVDKITMHPTRHDKPAAYETEAIIVISRADRGENN